MTSLPLKNFNYDDIPQASLQYTYEDWLTFMESVDCIKKEAQARRVVQLFNAIQQFQMDVGYFNSNLRRRRNTISQKGKNAMFEDEEEVLSGDAQTSEEDETGDDSSTSGEDDAGGSDDDAEEVKKTRKRKDHPDHSDSDYDDAVERRERRRVRPISVSNPPVRGRGKGLATQHRRALQQVALQRKTPAQLRASDRAADQLMELDAREVADSVTPVDAPTAKDVKEKMTAAQVKKMNEEKYNELVERVQIYQDHDRRKDENGNPIRISEFKIKVTQIRAPGRFRRVRPRTEAFVQSLMEQMKAHKYALRQPMLLLVRGVKSREEFDFDKIEEYEYEALGGNHSQEAANRLWNARPKDMHFVEEQRMLYKNAVLWADNMSDDECRTAGNVHNFDGRYHLDSSFMEIVRNYRNEWIFTYEPKKTGDAKEDKGLILAWQKKCLSDRQIHVVTSHDVRTHNPDFVTARWVEGAWNLLEQVNAMFENYELKGMEGKKKKKQRTAASSDEQLLNLPRIPGSYVKDLNGLEEGSLMSLLSKIISKQMTLREASATAKTEKQRQRVREAMIGILAKSTWTDVKRKLGRVQAEMLVESHYHSFRKVVKTENLPVQFVRELRAVSNAATAVTNAGALAGDDFKEFDLQRVVLSPDEWKSPVPTSLTTGEAEEAGEATANDKAGETTATEEAGEGTANDEEGEVEQQLDQYLTRYKTDTGGLTFTRVYSVNADVLTTHCHDIIQKLPLPSGNATFQLVVMDPPYGLNVDPAWDATPLTKENFKRLLTLVTKYNNVETGFTFISFCSAHQISGFLQAFKEFRSEDWKCHSTHGVWVKRNAHERPSYGSLACATEFLVFGWFTRKGTEETQLLRSLFMHKEGDWRGNVFEENTLKNKMNCNDTEGQRTVVNPCQKPIGLLRKFVEFFSEPNGNVLDLCGGTGSMAVACALSNRNCVTVDKTNFQVLKTRERVSQLVTVLESEAKDAFFKIDNREF